MKTRGSIQLYLLAAFACMPVTPYAADLTLATWGGDYALSQQRAYADTWREKTGETVKVLSDYNGGLGEIRAQVSQRNVVWDIVDVFAQDAQTGCDEGLFEKIPPETFHPTPDGTSLEDDLLVPLLNDCVVPNILWSWMVTFDGAVYADGAPSTIADFFDVERFPGPRGLSSFPQANIEMALMADGVPPGDVYDVMDTAEGIDRALRKLETLGPVSFWSSGEEPLDWIREGRVTMTTVYSGRVGAAVLAGEERFGMIFDGQVLEEEWLVLLTGSPNREQALRFLGHVSSTESQAEQARWIPYGPMRRSAMELIAGNEPWSVNGGEVLPMLPDRLDRLPRSVFARADWWAEHSAEITERFRRFSEAR